MTDIPLGVPVEIDGREVIIFRDVIGTESLRSNHDNEVLTIVEAEMPDGRPPIFIDESWLLRLRDAYPGIPVYGLWQLLFANGKVPLGNEVVVYPMGPDKGLYIRLNADEDLNDPRSILSSSEYIDNFISELLEYNLSHATRISVSIDELKLPTSPAYTRAEIFDRNRQIEQRRWILVGGVCVAIGIGTAIFNYAMYATHSARMTAYGNKQVELQTLNDRLTELKTRRLLSLPDNQIAIKRLTDIISYEPDISTPVSGDYGISPDALSSFANNQHVVLTSKGYPYNISQALKWLTVQKTPEARQVLSFSSVDDQGVEN